jgi:hypothetical protein
MCRYFLLPDAFAQVKPVAGATMNSLSFPDLDGTVRSLGDKDLGGGSGGAKCRLYYVFGSWCPNCKDCTAYLNELLDKYKSKGLAVMLAGMKAPRNLGPDYVMWVGSQGPLGGVMKLPDDAKKKLRDRLQPLCDVIFARPVRDYRARTKHALVRLGVIDEAHVRPPLRPLSKDARDLVDGALEEGGFL